MIFKLISAWHKVHLVAGRNALRLKFKFDITKIRTLRLKRKNSLLVQIFRRINVDEQDDYHVDNSLSLADCAEDFDVSDEPATSSSINTGPYQRTQRAEDAWAKLRQAALSTTFQKECSFLNSNRCHVCESKGDICCCLDWKKTVIVIVKNNSVNGQTTNSQPTVCQIIVDQRSAHNRLTADQQSADCWWTVGQLSVHCWLKI